MTEAVPNLSDPSARRSLVAIIADIHGNRQALEAVLSDLPPGAHTIVCLGDIVGYGADPGWCVDHIRESGHLVIGGNHDRACVDPAVLRWFNAAAGIGIQWTIAHLNYQQLKWLGALSQAASYCGAMVVHGSPRDPTFEYLVDMPVVHANLTLLGDRTCFHGHTHLPGIFEGFPHEITHRYSVTSVPVGGAQLINPGSVGQPRDGDVRASYGLWDIEGSTFEFRRLDYDREAAKAAIRLHGLPASFATRLDQGV